MKKLISVALACLSSVCYAQHSINIKLNGLSDTINLTVVNGSMKAVEANETLIAQNGEFTYDFKGDKARLAMIQLKTPESMSRLQFFLVPGEQGTLTGTPETPTWSGTKYYEEVAKLEAQTSPIREKMRGVSAEFQRKMKEGANRDSLQKILDPIYDDLSKQLEEVQMSYIKANPSSNVSASLLASVSDSETALNLLSPEVKNGVFSDVISALQAQVEKVKARNEAAKAVADGCVAPDFTLKDINGNDLTLSSLRGKYLVLDFWGSWCGWCIKGFPEMKKYYDKYSDRLEILGIDCNDTEDKWKAAVEKNELKWKHVYCPRTSDIPTKYAIQGYPTKLVLDPEGKIVRTVVGEDPAFYEFLDSLFK